MGHDIVTYGKIVKIKAGPGYEGPCASVKGRTEARETTNCLGSEVQTEGFAPMDQGNSEEQTRLR